MIYIGVDPGKNGGIAILSDTIPDVTVRVFSEDEKSGRVARKTEKTAPDRFLGAVRFG